MKEKYYCEECRKEVNVDEERHILSGEVKGVKYNYDGKIASCPECGAEVYVPHILDYNLEQLYKTIREQNGIISLEQVREIPKKYNIGKRPLSVLLGWGEQTFSRYCDGDIPTKQYSDTLLRIYNDPEYYAELISQNRHLLSNEHAYNKSMKAVSLLMSKETSPDRKQDTVISYVLFKCGDITPMALQKTLYYIQGFYYAFYNVFIFEEDCQAWVHGPVFREVYNKYKDYHFDPIKRPPSFNTSLLSVDEKAVCDGVINSMCRYSGKILEEFTHIEKPWLDARRDIPADEPSDKIISKQIIGDYFKFIKKKYNMRSPSDIEAYVKDLIGIIYP